MLETYRLSLLRYAIYVTRDLHTAEDLVQEAFVRVLAQPQRIAMGLPYLQTIVKNEFMTLLRRKKRQKSANASLMIVQPNTVSNADERVLHRDIMAAFNAISPRRKAAILATTTEDEDHENHLTAQEKIAETRQRHEGRKQIRQYIETGVPRKKEPLPKRKRKSRYQLVA